MVDKTDTAKPTLFPLLTTKPAKQREFTRRKDVFVFQGVHPADVSKFEADGWMVQREGSRKVRIRKPKDHDVMLEDQTWCLFYRMGYPELNGTGFKIRYSRQDGTKSEKQVDGFAKDDETVIVVECKARETRGKRSLQKDLHETESLQRPFANSIRAHYGADFKPKIIWMYVTNNIIWSEPDLERASAINVRVVTENEMQHFDSFVRHMGPAGRFQFLAEFLEGQEIPGLSDTKVPATRGTLGKHKFYSFVTTPRRLLKIAFVNHLALNHPDGRPAYQRMVSRSRIKKIGGFIKRGGFFPTNLLINFTEKCRFDLLPNKENADPSTKFGWLYLPRKYKSAYRLPLPLGSTRSNVQETRMTSAIHRMLGGAPLGTEVVGPDSVRLQREPAVVSGSATLGNRENSPRTGVINGPLALAAIGFLLAGPAFAQHYPSHPVRVVVGFAPGSTADIIARAIAQDLAQQLRQNFVVDNRPGVAGNISASLVAKSAPDGYTLLIVAAPIAINPFLYSKLEYDPLKDFAPISLLATTPNALVTSPSFPANSVKELIALAKAKPGELNFASSGVGTVPHLSGELFNFMTGVKMVHVAYKGPTEALIDVMAGRVQLMFANLSQAVPLIQAGKLKVLGVTSADRHPSLPNVPTLSEAGVPGYQATTWFGMMAPAGTPGSIITKLNKTVVDILGTKDSQALLASAGLTPMPSTPREFTAHLREEMAKWASIIKIVGAKAE